ncbi:MAG: energy-coupling factor transporter ATPase [Ruminococcaceae bacterium]|nr:energy-coupling factor transporter ATPase [Oscillospiraceae bacterium]
MSFIQARDLSFSYSPAEPNVINKLNLTIEKGSFVAVLGHNGCGKSTLAKLLCGILLPASGKVLVDGLDTAHEEKSFEIRKKCGMIFQNPDNQLVASVVEEDIAFAPENLGLPREEIRKRVDSALETVGMTEYARHATYKLSGGQKQRIAIAGVLAMSPECIIFDEATSMLDPNGRKEITAAMKRLNKEMGITVVTITHYMNEAVEADRIVVMNQGEIVADGTPEEIFTQVEKLHSVALDVPQVTELLYLLEKDGADTPRGVLHAMDAAEVITKLYKNTRSD